MTRDSLWSTTRSRALSVRRLAALTCCLLFVGTHSAAGQPQPGQSGERPKALRAEAGIGLLGGVPLGDFGDNVGSAGGASLHLGAGLGERVVSLGGEVSYLQYGNESRKVPWSATIPDALVTVNTDNSLLLVHALARVQSRNGRWRPYVDGLFGFKYIYTRTTIDLGTSCTVCSSDGVGTTNLDDFGLSYGGGGGVMIGLGAAPRKVKLDLSLRYLAGSESDYLREGAIRREDGQAILDVSRSRTDVIILGVGIAWQSR